MSGIFFEGKYHTPKAIVFALTDHDIQRGYYCANTIIGIRDALGEALDESARLNKIIDCILETNVPKEWKKSAQQRTEKEDM